MIQKVTTKSGSVYLIDQERHFWKKNDDPWERIWQMYCINPEDFLKWNNKEEYEKLPLQTGKKLYITSRDIWWLSTEIISIEEVEHVESN